MRLTNLPEQYSPENQAKLLVVGGTLIAVIALADWRIQPTAALGFLYLFPILLMSGFLTRGEIVGLASVCTILRQAFGPSDFRPGPGMAMAAVGFLVTGLFVRELARNRQLVLGHLQEIQREGKLRQEAEEQVRVLIETSPAAILTADASGRILLANNAALRLLAAAGGDLGGELLSTYLPELPAMLANNSSGAGLRVTLECRGRRRDGDVFVANACVSRYQTLSGPRLAAVVWDASEDLRDRYGLELQAVETASRILFGAMLHEVRNLSGAAAAAHANLQRVPALAENSDFRALGALVQGLEKVAASELSITASGHGAPIDLYPVLEDLRIVIQPMFEDSQMQIRWDLEAGLPRVRGDHHSLLRVFLNLARNSHRAMLQAEVRELAIGARMESDSVKVRFTDTGSGIPFPERLFQPFQHGADATGLGLYVSRALVRSFRGDLRYEPRLNSSCFAVKLLLPEEANGQGPHSSSR